MKKKSVDIENIEEDKPPVKFLNAPETARTEGKVYLRTQNVADSEMVYFSWPEVIGISLAAMAFTMFLMSTIGIGELPLLGTGILSMTYYLRRNRMAYPFWKAVIIPAFLMKAISTALVLSGVYFIPPVYIQFVGFLLALKYMNLIFLPLTRTTSALLLSAFALAWIFDGIVFDKVRYAALNGMSSLNTMSMRISYSIMVGVVVFVFHRLLRIPRESKLLKNENCNPGEDKTHKKTA